MVAHRDDELVGAGAEASMSVNNGADLAPILT
jgi:hypothetical protein